MPSTILPQTWIPSGLDVVRDGLWGRLGVQREFGETIVSGASEGLALHQDPASSRVLLYAGASNGGVHLRVYDPLSGSWSPRWPWVSAAGTGYEGSQSIGALAISEDGRYLAVGQGNPSNKAGFSAPSQGVQIGRINADGSLDWLPTSDNARAVLNGQSIRSLRWEGSKLLASSWDDEKSSNGLLLQINSNEGGIDSVSTLAAPVGVWELAGQGDVTLVAGYDDALHQNRIALAKANRTLTLQGETYEQLIESLLEEQLRITRLAVHPRRLDRPGLEQGVLVAFVGSTATNQAETHYIKRIDRLEVDPLSLHVLSVETYITTSLVAQNSLFNSIGTGQALNLDLYGNFSLASDPYDPEARQVYAGGNHYANSSDALALNYAGGLVSIRFDGTRGVISDFLYGPRISDPLSDQAVLITPFAPGQPHADSRRIAFFSTPSGPSLIQTDDGGIWQLGLAPDQPGQAAAGAWWQSLSAPGLNTLEHNMVDWSAASNSIAGSYQDNAASLGYFGDTSATNVWQGDGTIAINDDAGSADDFYTYIASQQYTDYGAILGIKSNTSGFVESGNVIDFYLQKPDQCPIPWAATSEADRPGAPFILPIEANAYRRQSIAMAGEFNVYESVAISPAGLPNTIVFEPLLQADLEATRFTAIDHQGSANQGAISSLYLGALQGKGGSRRSLLFGRQSNDLGDRALRVLLDFSLVNNGLDNAPIVDLAHAPTPGGGDRIYILQGGTSVLYSIAGPGPAQLLNILQPDGTLSWIDPTELGIRLTPGDSLGLQSVVFIPATPTRSALLVIGGLSGQWMSELDASGRPTGFEAMPWQGLPPDTAPGAPLAMTKYDPDDDLLIAATQGMGSWLYSFSGDLGSRPDSGALLHVADTTIIQRTRADLDKRGNQGNQNLYIQLDSRRRDAHQPIDVTITLHEAEAWRTYMDLVSLYSSPLRTSIAIDSLQKAYDEASDYINILTSAGLDFSSGMERDGDLIIPFRFNPDVNLFAMTLNAKEFSAPMPDIELGYSVSLADGSESLRRQLTLLSDPDASVTAYGADVQDFDINSTASISAANQQQIQQRNAELNATSSDLIYSWNLEPTSPAISPVLLSVPFAGKAIPAPADATEGPTTFTQVIYERDANNIVSAARTQGFDSTTRYGFRFYDVSGDGVADQFTFTTPPASSQALNDIWVSPARIGFNPRITPESPTLFSVGDSGRSDRVTVRLACSLQQRASRVSQIGALLLEPGEELNGLVPSTLSQRAVSLFSSLGPRADTLPAGSRFEREMLVGNGQRLLVFQVLEGSIADMADLNGVSNPSIEWFELLTQPSPQRLDLGSGDGTRLAVELLPGVQDRDDLIGAMQDQGPLLDLSAISPLTTVSAELGLGREAAFNTICGFYQVQNAAGTVLAADGRLLDPGDPSYRQEALRPQNLADGLTSLQVANRQTNQTRIKLSGGMILAPFARVNGEQFFYFAPASTDGESHFQLLGNNLIGLEDLPGLGDHDFNDLVMRFSFQTS